MDNEERIRELEKRVSVVETKVDNVKDDIKEIKDAQSKSNTLLLTTLASSLISLLTLVFNLLSKR